MEGWLGMGNTGSDFVNISSGEDEPPRPPLPRRRAAKERVKVLTANAAVGTQSETYESKDVLPP